jgi:hypothetical protein
MITELKIGHQVEVRGFIFTLQSLYITVHNLDGELMAILPILGDNGHRIVRSEEQFQTEVDFWIKDNLM